MFSSLTTSEIHLAWSSTNTSILGALFASVWGCDLWSVSIVGSHEPISRGTSSWPQTGVPRPVIGTLAGLRVDRRCCKHLDRAAVSAFLHADLVGGMPSPLILLIGFALALLSLPSSIPSMLVGLPRLSSSTLLSTAFSALSRWMRSQ